MKNKLTTTTLVTALIVSGFFATPAGMSLADHGADQTHQQEAWRKRTLGPTYSTLGRFSLHRSSAGGHW